MPLAAIVFAGILTLWIPGRWALSAFQAALLAYAAVRILRRWRAGPGIQLNLPAVPICAVAAWALIQTAAGWSVDPGHTFEAALDWTVRLAAFGLALEAYSEIPSRNAFLRAVLIVGTLLGVGGIFTALTSPPGVVLWMFDTGTGVPTLAPFVYKNQFAAFVEAILPIAVVGAITRGARHPDSPGFSRGSILHTLAAAVLLGAVITAGSRAGTILCLAEILLIPAVAFTQRRLSGKILLRAFAASTAAIAVLAIIVGWEPLWNRLQEANPYSLRRQLALSSLEMLRARPWTGFGLGAWSTAYPAFAHYDDGTFVNQAHNDWAQWGAEGGIPLLLATLGIAASAIRPALRSLWGVGILAVFAHSLIDYPMQQRPALAAFFFAMFGALWAEAGRIHKKPAARPG